MQGKRAAPVGNERGKTFVDERAVRTSAVEYGAGKPAIPPRGTNCGCRLQRLSFQFLGKGDFLPSPLGVKPNRATWNRMTEHVFQAYGLGAQLKHSWQKGSASTLMLNRSWNTVNAEFDGVCAPK